MQIQCGGIGRLTLAFLYPHVEKHSFIRSFTIMEFKGKNT